MSATNIAMMFVFAAEAVTSGFVISVDKSSRSDQTALSSLYVCAYQPANE